MRRQRQLQSLARIFWGIKDITITQELLISQDKNGHLLKLQRKRQYSKR
jgi:hypothetical protein